MTGARVVRVVQEGASVSVGWKITVADSWWQRLRGLLTHPPLAPGEGMLLLRCRSVHTVGMRHPIDVAFLDREGRIVRSVPHLAPGRVALGGRDAAHTLELPAGRLHDTRSAPGMRLSWS